MPTPRWIWLCSLIALLPACRVFHPNHVRMADEELAAALAPMLNGERYELADIQFGVELIANEFPSHAKTQLAAATLAYQAGQSAKAQLYLDRALRADPANEDALALRARVAIGDGNVQLARRVVERGIKIRPDAASLRETEAWVRHLQGDEDAALAALDEAERLGAPAWRVAFNRGLVFEGQGADDAAAAAFIACLRANDDCTAARQRLIGMGVPIPADIDDDEHEGR